MTFRLNIVLLVSICLQNGWTTDIVPSNLLKMQQGIGWPHSLNVVRGHEALLKLAKSVGNIQSCEVTTPLGETFDVRSPPSSRYEIWGDDCGVRVQNVQPEDEGRWRLTVVGDMNLTGWTELHVEADIDSYSASPISVLDGQTLTEVELTSLNNSYCLVAQPFAESSLVPGHCRVTLDRANRAVQGNWNVLVGLPGKVSELRVQRRVNVEAERLDVGYVHDTSTNKLHIYCNILHTVKNVTFCRFQMTTASYGYNVMDGLSDGTHSYYGDGFSARQCGITVESPTSADYGTWRCSVGVQQWVGSNVVQQTPLQALVRVLPDTPRARAYMVNSAGIKEVLVEEKVSFTLMCYAEVSLSYCWFQHPNGSQFTPVAQESEEQEFWYSGSSLQLGECGITFSYVRFEDAGEWTCHMGPNNQPGVEETDIVYLRVTGPLAANDKEVGARVGGEATLYCRTANGHRPLHYCRFLSPNRIGISIDSSVTNESAILDRYYFTPGRELYYGDCSLNINPVRVEDIGEWTCAALVDDQVVEARDKILVYVQNRQTTPLSQAGIIGMSIGAAVLLVVLAFVVLFKRGIRYKWNWKNNDSTDNNSGMIEMNTRIRPSNFSSSTSSSHDVMVFRAEAAARSQQNEN